MSPPHGHSEGSSHRSPQGEGVPVNPTALQDDNQQMLADSARDYVERAYGDAVRAASVSHADGCAPERWRAFAELGWLALPLPEQDGGLGGSLAEVCALAEELGRGLVNEPYIANAILGGMLLADLASGTPQAAEWLRGIAEGRLRVAFAAWEPGAGFDASQVASTAEPHGDGFVLHGTKTLVAGGAGADAYLLAARNGHGLGVFLVPAQTPGLAVTPHTLYDGQRVVDLQLDQVHVAQALASGPPGEIQALIDTALDRATIAACAETVGVMARAWEITLDYLKTRKQFGRVIAANQVVQHRMVDLYVEIEEARALTRSAAAALPGTDAGGRRRLVAATRACVVQAAKHVWEESVQLHGAIGMTQEYAVGPYVKRLALACTFYGGLETQLERLASAVLGDAA